VCQQSAEHNLVCFILVDSALVSAVMMMMMMMMMMSVVMVD